MWDVLKLQSLVVFKNYRVSAGCAKLNLKHLTSISDFFSVLPVLKHNKNSIFTHELDKLQKTDQLLLVRGLGQKVLRIILPAFAKFTYVTTYDRLEQYFLLL